jgi:hypothetical protein
MGVGSIIGGPLAHRWGVRRASAFSRISAAIDDCHADFEFLCGFGGVRPRSDASRLDLPPLFGVDDAIGPTPATGDSDEYEQYDLVVGVGWRVDFEWLHARWGVI